jgi:hypothetical protein
MSLAILIPFSLNRSGTSAAAASSTATSAGCPVAVAAESESDELQPVMNKRLVLANKLINIFLFVIVHHPFNENLHYVDKSTLSMNT